MTINVEKLPECKVILRVEVPAETAEPERKQIIKLFAGQAKIPGFRPGKIPTSVIEKRFKDGIAREFEERIVGMAMKKAAEDEKLEILSVAEVRDQLHNTDGSFHFTAELVTSPEFDLPDYKDIEVKVPSTDVTDDQLSEALDQIRERFADYKDIEDRPVAMGDFAVIDYKGTIGGEPVGEAAPAAPATLAQNTGFWLRMATDTFLPGFCEQLQGAKAGDIKEVPVTIPDDFPEEALRGQTIDYSVEVNELKEQVLPEVDDEFADKVEAGKTLAEVKDSLRAQMEKRREGYREEMITNQLLDKLNAELDFELPKEILMRETQHRVDKIVSSNSERGLGEDEIVKHQEEIIQAAGQQAAMSVKTSFIIEQIADAEEIKIEREELLSRVAEIAARNNTPVKKLYKQLEKQDGFGRIYSSLRTQKTLQFLRDNAKVVEVDPEEAASS